VKLRFLLQPGWLTLTAVVFAFAISCFTLLAPWQFDRHTERKAENAALGSAFDARPQPLAEAFPDGRAPDVRSQWTPVTLTGQYLAEQEVIARLRTVLGKPAYEVLTPLRLDSGEIVLVDRGFVRPDQRSRVSEYAAPPAGEVTVQARARIDERGSRPAELSDGRLHVYGVGSSVVSKATGLELRPGYFQLEGGQPGALEPLPLPRREAGPFLSYALQWIAFGVMAVLGWLYFTVRELKPGGVLREQGEKPRRKSVAEQLAEDDATATPAR
jgi:cytochrome oxidase assembly protein ShyY1